MLIRSNVDRLTQDFRYKGSPPTNHSSQKTRLINLSDGIKIWTDLSSILSQITRLTDGQTDKILIARIPCSVVKMESFLHLANVATTFISIILNMYEIFDGSSVCDCISEMLKETSIRGHSDLSNIVFADYLG